MYGDLPDDDDDSSDDASFEPGMDIDDDQQPYSDQDQEEQNHDQREEGQDEPETEKEQEANPQAFIWHQAKFHALASKGNLQILQNVLKVGYELFETQPELIKRKINKLDAARASPLHAAIIGGTVYCTLTAAVNGDPWHPDAAADSELLLKEAGSNAVHSMMTAQTHSLRAESVPHFECIRVLLEAGADPNDARYGRTPLQLIAISAALEPAAVFAEAVARLLLEKGADVGAVDGEGATALHYAAAACDSPIKCCESQSSHALLKIFIERVKEDSRTDILNTPDYAGRSPLHYATMLGGWRGMAIELAAAGAISFQDHDGWEPEDYHLRSAEEALHVPDPDAAPSSCTTSIFMHSACLMHTAAVGPLHTSLTQSEKRSTYGQPENADRLRCILSPYGSLRATRFRCREIDTYSMGIHWQEAPKANISDILRVHEYDYVQKLEQKCLNLKFEADRNPTQPAVGALDSDTELNQYSLEAALRGAGAAVAAVDSVCSGSSRNAFCPIRPPGHHAGPRGAVGGQSAGFCLFSNAAIAASYALACHRRVVKRVAIIDFDVHQGNGTEACVKNVVPTRATEELASAAGITLSIERNDFKPWLTDNDGDNIFFASIHGHGRDAPMGYYFDEDDPTPGGMFYPGSGGPGTNQDSPAVRNTPMDLRTHPSKWRMNMLQNVLIPLNNFKPHLVIISAGFDAHKDDPIDAGSLRDLDFAWMTSELISIAETHCHGRLVSLLEGGYSISGRCVAALGRAAAAHVSELMRPSLARGFSFMKKQAEPWSAENAQERLDRFIRAETVRSLAEEKLLEERRGEDAPSRRPKRSRSDVDYHALDAIVAREEAEVVHGLERTEA